MRLTDGTRPAYPYDLSELLLAIEVSSPSNPRLDFHIKRELYLRAGVAEYWVLIPDARNVTRWRGRSDPGELRSESVSDCDLARMPHISREIHRRHAAAAEVAIEGVAVGEGGREMIIR